MPQSELSVEFSLSRRRAKKLYIAYFFRIDRLKRRIRAVLSLLLILFFAVSVYRGGTRGDVFLLAVSIATLAALYVLPFLQASAAAAALPEQLQATLLLSLQRIALLKNGSPAAPTPFGSPDEETPSEPLCEERTERALQDEPPVLPGASAAVPREACAEAPAPFGTPDTPGLQEVPARDAALPDTALPDAALPDTALPDTALPDTVLPDAALPDTALPVGSLPVEAPMTALLLPQALFLQQRQRLWVVPGEAFKERRSEVRRLLSQALGERFSEKN